MLNRQKIWFFLGLGLLSTGTLAWSWLKFGHHPAWVQQDNLWRRASTGRGALAWVTGLVLTGFYIVLYWWPELLTQLIRPLDGFSHLLRARPADQWFLYGTFYTLAVLLMGGRALWKYRHSRYHIIRTLSVMFFQTGFSFILPALLQFFQKPEFYFSYFWPLKYDYLFPGTVTSLISNGQGLGVFMVFWGAVMSLLATPALTYFYGKRWYCSWVCGCGGLAETAGDPYRQLSDKSRAAWRWEVRIIYPVLGLIIAITALLWADFATHGTLLGSVGNAASKWYGFFIGSIFSGVIGGGLLPYYGLAGVVPLRLPHGGLPGLAAKALVPLPHQHQRRAVHFLRQLLECLRDGYRRKAVCAARRAHHPGLLRGLRHVQHCLPARRSQPGKWPARRPLPGFASHSRRLAADIELSRKLQSSGIVISSIYFFIKARTATQVTKQPRSGYLSSLQIASGT